MENKETYSSAIKSAIRDALKNSSTMICCGLGVTDPKGVFNTTKDLHKEFGTSRVFDMPTSENAMTGVGIGAAIMGIKVLMTHQRLDFFLLALDQLVNGAAKMHYMYGGELKCPLTIRLIVGRGWGQGPTHSQSLQTWFAHIPGLKVLMPTFPSDAKILLSKAIDDPNPVVFIEHRWLHNTTDITEKTKDLNIGEARICRKGEDITIVAISIMTLESLKAAEYLEKKYNISAEVIDLVSIKPIDYNCITKSVKKTKRLCVVDSGFTTCSIATEIISYITERNFEQMVAAPIRMAMPDSPEPTSYGLTRGFYVRAGDIAENILESFDKDTTNVNEDLKEPIPHDVPGDWFNGPF